MLEYCFGFMIKGLFKDIICNNILVIFTYLSSWEVILPTVRVFHVRMWEQNGRHKEDDLRFIAESSNYAVIIVSLYLV